MKVTTPLLRPLRMASVVIVALCLASCMTRPLPPHSTPSASLDAKRLPNSELQRSSRIGFTTLTEIDFGHPKEWSPTDDDTGMWSRFYGMPVDEVDPDDNMLLRYARHVVCYDVDQRYPVWAAHVLTHASAVKSGGKNEEEYSWAPDPDLAALGKPYATTLDYTNLNGIVSQSDPRKLTRGHMSSRDEIEGFGKTAESQTFYLSNVAPQLQRMNGGIWHGLEADCIALAKSPGVNGVWVITGPIFEKPQKPRLTNVAPGEGRLPLPAPTAFWKVVFFRSGSDLHVAAFIVPHQNARPRERYSAYQRPVAEVEEQTGLTFFPDYRPIPGQFKTGVDGAMFAAISKE